MARNNVTFARLLAIPGVRPLPDAGLTATFHPNDLPMVADVLRIERKRVAENRVVASVGYTPTGERRTWLAR